jgi:hypothetical protein
MRSHFVLASLTALFAGCVAQPPADTVYPLATAHAFQLSLERSAAHPGEIVMAKLRFTNTGAQDLWVPPRGQLTFGWKIVQAGGSDTVVTLPPSACNGIEYRRVSPARSYATEKGFVVPNVAGHLLVYVVQEPEITAPLEVQ